MTVGQLLARRRAVRDHAEALAANGALSDVARDFRRRAQAQLNAGHPELAQPFLDEAVLFEAAAQRIPGL